MGKKISRELIVTINRCRSNHYNFAASLVRVEILNDPKCNSQTGVENLDQVMWHCPLYDLERLN